MKTDSRLTMLLITVVTAFAVFALDFRNPEYAEPLGFFGAAIVVFAGIHYSVKDRKEN